MKTFILNTQILIIFWALISSGASTPQKHIGSDGRQYLIAKSYKYTWFQASHECSLRNRQLLIIDSAEKQAVINGVLNGIYRLFWLGANNEFNHNGNERSVTKKGQTFFWSATGKQFTYANWEDKYPEKIDGNLQCVLLEGNMKWVNWDCDGKYGFICEEKQLLESSNKNPNNASDVVQKFTNDFELKFLSILKDNMAQMKGKLENIEQVTNITQIAVQKILNKQEISTKEFNHEITKQGIDLSDQLKRSVDELNAKFNEKQNFTYSPKNIVLIKNTG